MILKIGQGVKLTTEDDLNGKYGTILGMVNDENYTLGIYDYLVRVWHVYPGEEHTMDLMFRRDELTPVEADENGAVL